MKLEKTTLNMVYYTIVWLLHSQKKLNEILHKIYAKKEKVGKGSPQFFSIFKKSKSDDSLFFIFFLSFYSAMIVISACLG